MKKTILFLVALVAIVAVYFAYNRSQHRSSFAVAESVANPPTGENGDDVAHNPSLPSVTGYKAYAQTLSDGVYRQDSVAIERMVELNGACASALSVKPSGQVTRDMGRLIEYCRGFQSAPKGGLDWSKSYASMLASRLDKIQSEQGSAAVGRELATILEDANAQQAQDALQYAADSGIVPASLESLVDQNIQGTTVQRDQLETLAYIEFCRRGGDCGANDFSTLTACAAIGPCQPGDTLVSIIRRKTTPENFEAAQKMSRALSNG